MDEYYRPAWAQGVVAGLMMIWTVPWPALFWPTVHPSTRCSHPVRVSMYGFGVRALLGVGDGVSPKNNPEATNAPRDDAKRTTGTRRVRTVTA
jgi:hypothetical protein